MNSKLLIWLLALLPLAGLAQAGQTTNVKIATVDYQALNKSLGYQILQDFERGESYRAALRDIKSKLAEAQERLIDTSKSEDLRKIQVEISFLSEKMSALSSIVNMQRRGSNGRDELEALIKAKFAKDYSIILLAESGYGYSGNNPLTTAIVANVEYVNITDAVATLVKKQMGEK